MKLIKENKFYVVVLEGNYTIEKVKKNTQKFWNNRRWRFNKIKHNRNT